MMDPARNKVFFFRINDKFIEKIKYEYKNVVNMYWKTYISLFMCVRT